MSPKTFSRLVELIYDAAADSGRWPQALTALADATGSQGAILIGHRTGGASSAFVEATFCHMARLDPDCYQAYAARHVDNPWSSAMAARPAGEVVASDTVLPLSALRRTAFYDDVLRPQGVVHNLMSTALRRDHLVVAFNLCRNERQGSLEAGDLEALKGLVPHLTRSLTLGFQSKGYAALQSAAFDAIERMAIGVILLDRCGTLTHANAAAAQLLRADGPLRLAHGRLHAPASDDSARLETALARALGGHPLQSLRLAEAHPRQMLQLVLTPLRGQDAAQRHGADAQDSAVMLFVCAPWHRWTAAAELLAQTHGLTPAESRVAAAIASGCGIDEAARWLSVSANTVKTHLARVFDKTGTRRQSELSSLLALLPWGADPPIRKNHPNG